MANTALTQLQEQIEAVRREAFADGYRAAMQTVLELASRPPAAAPVTVAPSAQPSRPLRQRRQTRPPAVKPEEATPPRPQRGANARLVEAVLQSIAPRAARPTEIRNALRREKGIAMAFTSIRHALGQLEARRAAEQIANTKTWRYLSQGAG